jgi:tRNA modification GTPase
VRVSGPGAAGALEALFEARGPRPTERCRQLCLGQVRGRGAPLDTALAVFFPSPDSMTGQDVAEFHLHGSPGSVRGLMDALLDRGLRPALPGEFSYRAVLNGKMSVMAAEAVNALVAAETPSQASQLGGGGTGEKERELRGLREELLDLRAAWEAGIDFPDEAAPPKGTRPESIDGLVARLDGFVEGSRSSRQLREGWRVALVGPVNSGKSSLFNALLKRERALVSPHPGTTRDVLEEAIQVGGYPLVLLDVAGVRSPADAVEAMGMERGLEAARSADGMLLVYDASKGWGSEEEAAMSQLLERPIAILANKRDLAPGADIPEGSLGTSALTGEGLEALVRRIGEWIEHQAPPSGAHLLVSERQIAAVNAARAGCARARDALGSGLTEEVALQGLAEAQSALDDLLTGGSPEDLYDRIFASFCIGK